jgi:glycosyltransferase involved in cell wall biosynthesis
VTDDRPNEPLVSVLVPVRNGGAELGRLLEALGRQTLPRHTYEVILGDDGSTDGSTDLPTGEDGWLRIERGPPVNSYAARNRAARSARAPVLAFCDVDCEPEPGWLEAGLAGVREADLVGGAIRFIVPDHPSVWTYLDMETFLDQQRSIENGYAVGANLFVRRELFDRLDGFDETLPSGGDFDFGTRAAAAGARLAFAGDAVVGHPTRDGARPFLRKIWLVARCYGARQRRVGRRPAGLRLAYWLPVVGTIRSRRRLGRPLLLDRERLEGKGAAPRLRDVLSALPLLYLVLPYLGNAAHLRGWWDARTAR